MTTPSSRTLSRSVAARLAIIGGAILLIMSACGGAGSVLDDVALQAARAAQVAAANADEAGRAVLTASDETARVVVLAADEAAIIARTAADDAARAAAAATDDVARTAADDAAAAARTAAERVGNTILDSAQSSRTFAEVVGQWRLDSLRTSQWTLFLNETQQTVGRVLSSEEVAVLKDIFLEVTCAAADSSYVGFLIEREMLKEKLVGSLPGLAGIPDIDLAMIESRNTIEEQFAGFVVDNQLEAVLPGIQFTCQFL